MTWQDRTTFSRRHFLTTTGALCLAPSFVQGGLFGGAKSERRIMPCGPASKYVPRVHAAFVRRKGEYGIKWPGAVYDGEAALRNYSREIMQARDDFGLDLTLREQPLYSLAETQEWLAQAQTSKVDGLLLVVLDRQEHAWPSAAKTAGTGIPTVIFSPVGTSFTTNTAPLANKPGVLISSTSDFSQARFGLKMLKAGAKLREMRYLVIRGNKRQDTELQPFGTRLRYIPASTFLERYNQTPTTVEIENMAAAYLRSATKIRNATRDDLLNGIKSYVVARELLEREEADAITMDCLGALGLSKVSLPCIAWSRMLDQNIPAACEADLGACVTHALVQLLFDRPGFQQDPVAETTRQCLIGAHCSCPTRLNGFDRKPEQFDITHHHGNRDAVPRTRFRKGQRITIADVLLPGEDGMTAPRMVIGTGTVVDNLSVPPHGGCVVSVEVKLDTRPDLLSYPGFHQVFFYGDSKRELMGYCQLFGIQPVVA